jgi:hypothetical protein
MIPGEETTLPWPSSPSGPASLSPELQYSPGTPVT